MRNSGVVHLTSEQANHMTVKEAPIRMWPLYISAMKISDREGGTLKV